MSWQATQAISEAIHIRGAARAVLYALAQRADRRGRSARPCQATLALEAGVTDRTVRRSLVYLETCGYIRRMGGRRKPGSRGRLVVVWRLVLSRLRKPDIVSDRTRTNKQTGLAWRVVRAFVPRDPAKAARSRRQEAINELAERYGWPALMAMGQNNVDRLLFEAVPLE